MKIGIDGRLSGIAHTGIGRYVENLLLRLPELDQSIDWVYFFREKSQFLDLPGVENILAPVGHYTLAEQTQLVSIFNQQKLDILHVPHFNAPMLYQGKLVLTIHDLLWHEQRGGEATTLQSWEYWAKYLGYKTVVGSSINKAKKIIVPTASTKKTVLEHYPQTEGKIVITHEGIDDRLSQYKKKTTRDKNTLIYVGSLYPHKNVELVIKALKELPKWEFKVVGARDVFQEKTQEMVKKNGVEKQVKFLGRLSDQELAKELQQATALVQPSLSEGFGLTGIEAMSLNTPVISSNIPVLQEIYQDGAIFFDPRSVASFVKTVNNLAKEQPTIKQMESVVERYSWDKMAQETLEIYRQIYEA